MTNRCSHCRRNPGIIFCYHCSNNFCLICKEVEMVGFSRIMGASPQIFYCKICMDSDNLKKDSLFAALNNLKEIRSEIESLFLKIRTIEKNISILE